MMTQDIFIRALAKAIVQFKEIHKQKNKSNMTKPTINLSGVWQAIHTGVIKITTFLKAHILDAVSIGNAIKEIAAGGSVVDASIEAIIEMIPGGKNKTADEVKSLASAIEAALKATHFDSIKTFVHLLRDSFVDKNYKAAVVGKFVTVIIQQMHGDPTVVTEIYDLLRVAGYADTEGLEQLDIADKPMIGAIAEPLPYTADTVTENAYSNTPAEYKPNIPYEVAKEALNNPDISLNVASAENVHANMPDGTVDKTKPYFKDGAWVNPGPLPGPSSEVYDND